MPLKADLLNDLEDEELQTVIGQCNELLKQRDKQRKDEALEKARAILAIAGLKLSDVAAGKSHKNGSKAPVYHGGHQYQHPTNKALTWNAKGQKPGWLRELEAEGRRAVEMAPGNDVAAVKKAG